MRSTGPAVAAFKVEEEDHEPLSLEKLASAKKWILPESLPKAMTLLTLDFSSVRPILDL